MARTGFSSKQVGTLFTDKWWSNEEATPQVYDDLIAKLSDPSYIVKGKAFSVNRAVLACQQVISQVPNGGRVLDMACGLGFNACCLVTHGYQAEGFDISDKAIERAKALARRLGQAPEMFSLADHEYVVSLPDASLDAVVAMGMFRYLDRTTQDATYREVHRILKPGGQFLISQDNILFNIFALNDGALQFWADAIDSQSAARQLLGDKSAYQALNEIITVPKRVYGSHSVSNNMPVEADNPLTYQQLVTPYGFRLDAIRYPITNILPPPLEAQVDQETLENLKRKVRVDRAENWLDMFMADVFIAFLVKE